MMVISLDPGHQTQLRNAINTTSETMQDEDLYLPQCISSLDREEWCDKGLRFFTGEQADTQKWAEPIVSAFGPLSRTVKQSFLARRKQDTKAANQWLRDAHQALKRGHPLWRELYGPSEFEEKARWCADLVSILRVLPAAKSVLYGARIANAQRHNRSRQTRKGARLSSVAEGYSARGFSMARPTHEITWICPQTSADLLQ